MKKPPLPPLPPAPSLFEMGSTFDDIRAAEAREGISSRAATDARKAQRRIGSMHRKHGHGPELVKCGECQFLDRHAGHKNPRSYFKCALFGVSASEATDWRVSWPACGKFQRREPQGE